MGGRDLGRAGRVRRRPGDVVRGRPRGLRPDVAQRLTVSSPREFRQVDVFSAEPLLGNPVAVVHGAEGLTDEQMQAFAR
ncbi:PhzF family phenazine biosynthesis protein, partial [Nocardioides sp. GCM10030258]|uniref:PhzF family phenazine biosynthesis protein n=1 Tax=unclassified Nocardioides TaxID=2615069 RepID=UPI00361B8D4C